eukprot:TRINITY_DN4442_c0_g2_i1.p1 TRINITY_DN4442_c0_g2~~TRINITY_DN4442_c0_g2_i1.p1  ORF type:complete len:437 (+),score=90.59 TRINITY_DN4442_c0_g2_i1:18-1328(+)
MEKVIKQYNRLFRTNSKNLLRSEALHMRIQHVPIRSLIWKVFLNVLDQDEALEIWIQKITTRRDEYDQLISEFDINPRGGKKTNPLARDNDSEWSLYFENEKIKKTIMMDINRTYPEYQFFHTDEVKKMILNVLFVYAKKYPEIGYRQGMHDLAAPILYLVNEEKLDVDDEEPLSVMFDQSKVEQDTWIMFEALMMTAQHFYGTTQQTKHTELAVTEKCEYIQNILLKKVDPYLSTYFNNLEVLPQIYLLRWLRIMFGREFSLRETLLLWDAIFAWDYDLSLCDYISVAMLYRLRDTFIESDYNDILGILFRYPSDGMTVESLLELTLDIANTDISSIPYIRQKEQVKRPIVSIKNEVVDHSEIPEQDKKLAKRLTYLLEMLQGDLYNENTVVPQSTYLIFAELKQIKGVIDKSLPIDVLTPLELLSEQLDNAHQY